MPVIPYSFVHIPKTGGMSVATAICGRQGFHHRASELSGFIFTFVRHPLDRMWSAFEFLRDPVFRQGVIPEATRFEDFVLARGWRESENDVFKPMVHWIDAPVSFIGRFERLADDFREVCRRIGFVREITLPHMHRRERTTGWRDVYTSKMRDLVSADYAEDMVTFDYGD